VLLAVTPLLAAVSLTLLGRRVTRRRDVAAARPIPTIDPVPSQ
jgi:hypothetical protein